MIYNAFDFVVCLLHHGRKKRAQLLNPVDAMKYTGTDPVIDSSARRAESEVGYFSTRINLAKF